MYQSRHFKGHGVGRASGGHGEKRKLIPHIETRLFRKTHSQGNLAGAHFRYPPFAKEGLGIQNRRLTGNIDPQGHGGKIDSGNIVIIVLIDINLPSRRNSAHGIGNSLYL